MKNTLIVIAVALALIVVLERSGVTNKIPDKEAKFAPVAKP